MKNIRKMIGPMLMALALTFVSFVPVGCAHKLDPAGVYAGDQFLYESENTINTAHDTFREFLVWETQFRNVLPVEVSRAADFVRVNEERWLGSANALHDAYVRTPSAENKDKLQLSLNLIQTALREAAAYMIASKEKAPNNGLKNIKPLTAGGSAGVLPVKK